MPATRDALMQTLYGRDIWAGFQPVETGGVQGWNGDHPSLGRLAAAPGAKVVVDVGVWKGQSTINMALAMKAAGIDGAVIGVDTFLGSPEHWLMEGGELFARVNGLPDLYRTFLSNVVAAGVQDYIVPMPQTSTTAAQILRRLGITASVAHIDAAHEHAEVLRDAQEYWAVLQPGGFLIGDDYHWTWAGVMRAAADFTTQVGRPFMVDGVKWIVEKPS